MGEFGFWIFMSVLLVFTVGEPDLIDRLVHGEGSPVLERMHNDSIDCGN